MTVRTARPLGLFSVMLGLVALIWGAPDARADALDAFEAKVTHHQVQNGDVQLHYATSGAGAETGAPVLFLHGFPDHWLTWWRQMEALDDTHLTAAMDLRGFNLSDQPTTPEAYRIETLIDDVAAVITDLGGGPVTLVGHDFGGYIAWSVAMQRPDLVSRLVIVNIPHPWAVARELAENPAQQAASAYVNVFRSPGAAQALTTDQLSTWVTDKAFLARHVAAMGRSNPAAMLNYYHALFPHPPFQNLPDPAPKITAPTLVLFGAQDPYLLAAGLNGTWDYIDAETTLVVWPDAGHFTQQDKARRMNDILRNWLMLN